MGRTSRIKNERRKNNQSVFEEARRKQDEALKRVSNEGKRVKLTTALGSGIFKGTSPLVAIRCRCNEMVF